MKLHSRNRKRKLDSFLGQSQEVFSSYETKRLRREETDEEEVEIIGAT